MGRVLACGLQEPRKEEEISPERKETELCMHFLEISSLATKEKPKATSSSPCNGSSKADN